MTVKARHAANFGKRVLQNVDKFLGEGLAQIGENGKNYFDRARC
jgi:hypothetical protein